jgi:hypothetical protein
MHRNESKERFALAPNAAAAPAQQHVFAVPASRPPRPRPAPAAGQGAGRQAAAAVP